MRIPRFIAALALSAASALPLPASAGQLSQSPALSDGLIVNVGGCHRDVERHYVPEWGRRAWHYHRRSSCRPRRADAPGFIPGPPRPVDCHRDARRHYLPEYGGSVVHRHVGDSRPVRDL